MQTLTMRVKTCEPDVVALPNTPSYFVVTKELTMSSNRVIYRNWIVEIGLDPAKLKEQPDRDDLRWISLDSPVAATLSSDSVQQAIVERESAKAIRHAVHEALEKLSEQEKEFITQFYFIGKSYRQISDQSGRPVHKLEALHKRAVKKLRKELSSFVHERFGIVTHFGPKCPICLSSFVAQINRLIANRDMTDTWKPIIKVLRERYGLKVTSPQVLIGHERYHMRHTTSPRGKRKEGRRRGE